MDVPATSARTTSVSQSEFRRRATKIPRATPSGTAMRRALPASRGVTRSAGAITSMTGVLAKRNDRPKSPRAMPATYEPNCRHSGRSSPYSARSFAASAASPDRSLRSVMIGSPGTNWFATKVRTTAASSTGRRPSTRRSAYALTRALAPPAGGGPRLVELDGVERQEPEWRQAHALDVRLPERDLHADHERARAPVRHQQLLRLRVDCVPGRVVGDALRTVDQLVELGVLPAGPVEGTRAVPDLREEVHRIRVVGRPA